MTVSASTLKMATARALPVPKEVIVRPTPGAQVKNPLLKSPQPDEFRFPVPTGRSFGTG